MDLNTWLVVAVFVGSIFIHEAGHALTAIALGYKLKKFYLGIPFDEIIRGKRFTTNVVKFNYKGVEYGISLLLMGGAVDFYGLEDAPYRKFYLVVAYGLIASLLAAFVPMLFYFDFQTSFYIFQIISQVVLASIGQLISGGMPLENLVGPVGAIKQMQEFAITSSNGFLLLWIVLNASLFVTNIIPIPALDGGHLLICTINFLTKDEHKKKLERVTWTFWYSLMVLMVVVLTKDLW